MATDHNYEAIRQYMQMLDEYIRQQLEKYFQPPVKRSAEVIQLVEIKSPSAAISKFIKQNKLSKQELLVLLMALMPHFKPDFFDESVQKMLPASGDFPEIGGVRGKNFRGFLPTGETALFFLSGMNLEKRMHYQSIFSNEHPFAKQAVLWLEDVPPGEPAMSGRIILSAEYLELFTTGKVTHPKLSIDFPAQYISTDMEWDDLVLHDNILQQIYDLEKWVKYNEVLMNDWDMKRKLKPGYRALFHGPPGTGKTLTATLLGKYTGKDVFRIDLSMVVSKFIGETEKNLSQLFNRAENKNWILFFDEADALFSKRTNVRDAHDKYANQEAAYLLQRIENFDGLVILATNFKNNIDEAFIRRFQSVIHFPAPGVAERLELWKRSFPPKLKLNKNIDLAAIAKKYEVTGSSILSVVQYCCLQAISKGSGIDNDMLIEAVKREYLKEGKIW
jgi:DNA polymerase III delta prime subunit